MGEPSCHLTLAFGDRFGPNPHWMRARKFAGNSFDVACIQCEHFHLQEKVPFAFVRRVALRLKYVQCGLGLGRKGWNIFLQQQQPQLQQQQQQNQAGVVGAVTASSTVTPGSTPRASSLPPENTAPPAAAAPAVPPGQAPAAVGSPVIQPRSQERRLSNSTTSSLDDILSTSPDVGQLTTASKFCRVSRNLESLGKVSSTMFSHHDL